VPTVRVVPAFNEVEGGHERFDLRAAAQPERDGDGDMLAAMIRVVITPLGRCCHTAMFAASSTSSVDSVP
jgi:hypothetical protein